MWLPRIPMERMAFAVGWQLNASNNSVVGLYNDSAAPWVLVVMQVQVSVASGLVFGYLQQGFNPTVGDASLVQPGQYIRTNRGKPPGTAVLDDITTPPLPQWLFEYEAASGAPFPPTPAPIAILDPGWTLAVEIHASGPLEAAFYYACMRPEELDPAWDWGETE